MVMRLVGEEAALCLKNRERDSLMGILETDGAGGLADLNPKVRRYPVKLRPNNCEHFYCLVLGSFCGDGGLRQLHRVRVQACSCCSYATTITRALGIRCLVYEMHASAILRVRMACLCVVT